MTELAFQPASDLCDDIRNRKLSSRELLDHYLARIERFDGQINALATLDAENARRRADEADAALARGEHWGPLHGLPMTVKDVHETAGLRTTAGCEQYTDHVPEHDSLAVARLKAAGAVIFGKTNCPELAMDWQTYNALFGTTNNPWDLTRTPGGSSGGAAAAVAAGLTGLELGGDIGGSIRLPAGFCGVFGHKPTWGVIPTRGHIPPQPGTRLPDDVNVVGPIARAAEDLALALDVLAGPTPEDAPAWQLRLPPPRHDRLRDYRVALWLDDPTVPVDAAVGDVLEAAAEALRAEGSRVVAAEPPADLRELQRVYRQLVDPLMVGMLPGFEDLASQVDVLERLDPEGVGMAVRNATALHVHWRDAAEQRERLRAAWADFFRDVDVLLCPVAPVPAFPHDQREPLPVRRLTVNGEPRPYTELWPWCGAIGGVLLPSTSTPVGRTPEGLPVGVQVVGPHFGDRSTIDFAGRLAARVGGYDVPPGWF